MFHIRHCLFYFEKFQQRIFHSNCNLLLFEKCQPDIIHIRWIRSVLENSQDCTNHKKLHLFLIEIDQVGTLFQHPIRFDVENGRVLFVNMKFGLNPVEKFQLHKFRM